MKAISKIGRWGDAHHPKILDIIRIILGVLLIVKGAAFYVNSAYLREAILQNVPIKQSPEAATALIYYVVFAHLVCGALIFLGLFTRIAAIILFPVIFGAVFFVNILLSYVNSELWLSILVLALLILFIIIGSGPLSIDHFISRIRLSEKEST